MDEVTVIFFSCRRLEILKRSVWSFIKNNTYPISEYIIVNDSGDPAIWKQLEESYENATLVLNEENVGLVKSIDNGYEHIKTEYLFHCEDDWVLARDGFIDKAIKILKNNPLIEEVWPLDMNDHPLEKKIYGSDSIHYRLVKDNYLKGQNGYNDFGWHGFTTACAVKRLSDYKKVAPYAAIPYDGTIWHREQAIGERYHDLGYRSAVLPDQYAYNIGYGLSEYKPGVNDGLKDK